MESGEGWLWLMVSESSVHLEGGGLVGTVEVPYIILT